jgi:hypothetical protein
MVYSGAWKITHHSYTGLQKESTPFTISEILEQTNGKPFQIQNYKSQIKFISHLIQCEQKRKYMIWNIPWQVASKKNTSFWKMGCQPFA